MNYLAIPLALDKSFKFQEERVKLSEDGQVDASVTEMGRY